MARGFGADTAEVYRSLLGGIDQTDFVGYESEVSPGRLLQIVREGSVVERADKGEEVEVFLDRTPFYAESGGQVGDSGTVTTETGTIRVVDTRFALPGVHGHRGKVVDGYVVTGQDAEAEVDHVRRERIRKNHTGTHILHWALRDIVGDHVHQAGSLVESDRLRFDFSHFASLDEEEILAVERATNERIIENAAVTTVVTSKDEAEDMGALAFFGDKYGDRVRVVRAGDYSTEFCGGTHVPSTGQVGPLILVSEGSVGSNLRRVEALTGTRAYEHLVDLRRTLEGVATTLRTQPGSVVEAASSLTDRVKAQEARIEAFEAQTRSRVADRFLGRVERRGDHGLVVGSEPGLAPDEVRALALQVRRRLGSGIGVLGSAVEGKGVLVAFVSEDLIAAGISAAQIIAPAAKVLGGGGSRDPELAQAGGPHGDRLPDALEVAEHTARAALEAL
jgi:alanyl-tRNA synthetase